MVPHSITVRREAMATDFSITIVHTDPRYARQAATECLCKLDALEQLLSRFVNHSDIARIGRLDADHSLPIAAETYDCLRIALQVEAETQGAFNIAYQHRPSSLAAKLLKLVEPPPTVRVTDASVPLDLGGIGKGFALDHMAAALADWELPSYLLRASASTLLAGSPPPETRGWPIRLGPSGDRRRLLLSNVALSGSGTAVKGGHIFDPTSALPAMHFRMTWAGATSAAQADAMSTALMVMHDAAIKKLCQRRPDVLAYVLVRGADRIRTLSKLPQGFVGLGP